MGLLQTMRRGAALLKGPARRNVGASLALAGALALGVGGGLAPLLEAASAFAKGPEFSRRSRRPD